MQIGVIGLGRMGGNISRRLMQNGHEVVVYDHDPKAIATVAKDGAKGVEGLDKLVAQLMPPRPVWVMLPAGKITEDTIVQLGKLLEAGDIVHRRRQYILEGRYPPRQDAPGAQASTTSMSARAAACGGSSAAIA